MNVELNSICNDLLAIQLDDGVIDLSWAIDTDRLKDILDDEIEKILNFREKVNFVIQIDNVNTFDSINLKQYTFSNLEQTYRGNIVYSAIINFNKNKFEETNYYFRVKILNETSSFNVLQNGVEQVIPITFEDSWSEAHSFTIRKNYTKDLVETMYSLVADFNAYNKEAKSANMYYIFQAIATSLNEQFDFIQDEKERTFINKSLPDFLVDTFGVLFKFVDSYGLSMEEYRRILSKLIVAYQRGGAWNYIKEVLKYLVGYTPELFTLKNFYPWILRKAEIIGYTTDGQPIYNWEREDPNPFSNRNYYNPDSNYYLYKSGYAKEKNKNSVMLTSGKERLFTFIVKTENFFNVSVDSNKMKQILNLLKSAYTKYSLNIEKYMEPSANEQYILADDTNVIFVNPVDDYLRY